MNLKTRPEMTLAGVVVLHVTYRNNIGLIIRSTLGGAYRVSQPDMTR